MTDAPRPSDDDGVEDPLGAAATLPGKRGDRSSSDAPRRTGRRRGGKLALAAAAIVILLLALVPAVTSTLAKTPRDRIGISYGGGPIEGAHFQKIVQPGSGLFFNGLFDDLYLYPADQRNYIISAADADDGDDPTAGVVTAPTKDQVQVGYQVAVYYRLNTDLLREFHEELGLKYSAYTTAGWNDLIQDTFRQQIEAALQEQTRRYDVADLFGNVEVLLDLQQQVEQSVSTGLVDALGAEFFCSPTFEPGGECGSPTFVVKKIDIPQPVAASFERVRVTENEVFARTNEARAIEVIADALAEAPDYVKLKAIESGQVTFWVLPDGGVTIAAPGEATDGAAPPSTGGG